MAIWMMAQTSHGTLPNGIRNIGPGIFVKVPHLMTNDLACSYLDEMAGFSNTVSYVSG